MDNFDAQLNELRRKIESVIYKQKLLNDEVVALMDEFDRVKEKANQTTHSVKEQAVKPIEQITANEVFTPPLFTNPVSPQPKRPQPGLKLTSKNELQNGWEEFIGGNVLSKVGILITIIGIFIGVKYAIDHDLISPATRIILGYVLGGILIGFALKLKAKYQAFSAVLMGGGIAAMYFVTYVAYSFYNLLPVVVAFLLMFLCTAGVVMAALRYKNQIIALVGLFGAYAIPILLSDGSGRFAILFSYMAIINVGIMILSFRQNWKSLFYAAFAVTWVFFIGWYIFKYQSTDHLTLGLIFLIIFFLTFYITFLAYKLVKKEQYAAQDVLILLLKSFIFYGIGYDMLESNIPTQGYAGLFTVINAGIHFSVCMLVKKMKLADKALFYLLIGLVFVFLTIAVPVQLDGNWVTLLWAGEAALLFGIGRTQSVGWYEKLAIPLVILSTASLLQDWNGTYSSLQIISNGSVSFRPVLNINFISSVLVCTFFGVIIFIANSTKYKSALKEDTIPALFFKSAVPLILLFVIYLLGFLEINETFSRYYYRQGFDFEHTGIKYLWLINYSFAFVSLLAVLNQRFFKKNELGVINMAAGMVLTAVFLVKGFILLGDLRDSYLANHYISATALYLRYICFAFAGLWMIVFSFYRKWEIYKPWLTVFYAFVMHVVILSLICNEFIHQMDLLGYHNQYKLGLSIICGSYAVMLIVIGIWKKKQYLRVGAISLFGLTLIKLFFYDIAQLSTISKTIVMIVLGIMLLVTAFLYNKYKHVILGEESSGERDHSS